MGKILSIIYILTIGTLVHIAFVVFFLSVEGCRPYHEESINKTPDASGNDNQITNQDANTNNIHRKDDIMEAMAFAQKEYDEKMHNLPTNEMRLPNFETGPGRPLPLYLNFYTIDRHFPSYLLCEYPVEDKPYAVSNEIGRLKSALEQIRHTGSIKFPPIKWIVVAIHNIAEHKDIATFEKSYKVAAIFSADDVFDTSRDMSILVCNVELDRKPFKYYQRHTTSGEQQRWLIVERHSATNQLTKLKTTMNANRSKRNGAK